jgi:hypothetical protein
MELDYQEFLGISDDINKVFELWKGELRRID